MKTNKQETINELSSIIFNDLENEEQIELYNAFCEFLNDTSRMYTIDMAEKVFNEKFKNLTPYYMAMRCSNNFNDKLEYFVIDTNNDIISLDDYQVAEWLPCDQIAEYLIDKKFKFNNAIINCALKELEL